MHSKKEYRSQLVKLRRQLQNAAGVAALYLPDRLDEKSRFYRDGPSPHDNPALKLAADAIDDAMAYFDLMQRAMGLPERYPTRFEKPSPVTDQTAG